MGALKILNHNSGVSRVHFVTIGLPLGFWLIYTEFSWGRFFLKKSEHQAFYSVSPFFFHSAKV